MLTHDLSTNSCCDNLVEMEPAYRTKSNLNKNLFNQKESGYSSHSIVQCMENFVDAVHEMDDTILVPSRLMDLKVDTSVPELAGGCGRASSSLVALLSTLPDLFTLYTMVRALKNQLQWGGGREPYEEGPTATAMAAAGVAGGAALLAMAAAPHFLGAPMLSKGHARRPSTASMASTNSASSASSSSAMSEPDSEASSVENDSGIDAELEAACSSAKCISAVELIEQNFQRHLRGLADTLNQLTEAARYVTKRYQKDVLGVE